MFCKQLLGVQKQTTTNGILLELVMVPISFSAIKASIKNWNRIRNKNSNNLLYMSYENALKENLTWTSRIKTLLESNGLLQSFITINKVSKNNKEAPIEKLIFQRLSDQFHQNAFESIRDESSKLKTYSTLKDNIGLEDYLTNICNIKYRSAMTKLRLSNHVLLVETGRHLKIDRNLRFCPFCPSRIEDEIHFLIKCPTYKEIRDNLLPKNILNNTQISDNDKFKYILSGNELNTTAKFIYEAFEERKIALDAMDVIKSMISIVAV